MILDLFRRRTQASPTAAETAYAQIVAQARRPHFYADLGVPDTPIGRFEMILMHAFLYFHRLRDAEPAAKSVAQEAFDLMFADMDASLRELGIGDVTVPKRIKTMAGSFYGRCQVYEAALARSRDDELIAAVSRNVYGYESGEAAGALALADYMRRAEAMLVSTASSTLLSEGPSFPSAEESA